MTGTPNSATPPGSNEKPGHGVPAKKSRRGGARPGAGRKPGGRNALPLGAVAAMKAAGLRVPADATPAHRLLADMALARMVDVMDGRVSSFGAFSVLTAARAIREEVCGPVPKRLEHTGANGGPLVFIQADE